MALTRRQSEEDDEVGWSSGNTQLICANCVDDSYLKRFIRDNGHSDRSCHYCDTVGQPVVVFDHLMEVIGKAVSRWFRETHLDGTFLDDGRFDTEDLVRDYLMVSEKDRVVEDVVDALGDDHFWCERHFWSGSPSDTLTASWNDFVRLIKQERRHFFAPLGPPTNIPGNPRSVKEEASPVAPRSTLKIQPMPHDGERAEAERSPTPYEILLDLERMVTDLGLIQTSLEFLRAWTFDARELVLWRARVVGVRAGDPKNALEAAPDFGPPETTTAPNRMSPTGVVMFYGAIDPETAIVETFQPQDAGASAKRVGVAAFRARRPLLLLNLAELPSVPSVFDPDGYHRHELIFLHRLVEDLTKPVHHDGREHIEYVPTQIVSEYFRHQFRTGDGKALDGILFESSKRKRGVACVLFLDRAKCGIGPYCKLSEQILEFCPDSIRIHLGTDWRSWFPGTPFDSHIEDPAGGLALVL